MQVAHYSNASAAWCIDATCVSFAYSVMHVQLMGGYRTNLKHEHMHASFQNGNRYDVLGYWPALCEVDPDTGISLDVTDEEILAYTRGLT